MRRRIGKHRTQRGQINANVSSTKDTEADVVTGNAEEAVAVTQVVREKTVRRGAMDRG